MNVGEHKRGACGTPRRCGSCVSRTPSHRATLTTLSNPRLQAPLAANTHPATVNVTGLPLCHWSLFPPLARVGGRALVLGDPGGGFRDDCRLAERKGQPWTCPALWKTGFPRSGAAAAVGPGNRKLGPPYSAPLREARCGGAASVPRPPFASSPRIGLFFSGHVFLI